MLVVSSNRTQYGLQRREGPCVSHYAQAERWKYYFRMAERVLLLQTIWTQVENAIYSSERSFD